MVGDDGQIPYKPEAARIKQENSEHWIDRDPELKCYLPGIPRALASTVALTSALLLGTATPALAKDGDVIRRGPCQGVAGGSPPALQ